MRSIILGLGLTIGCVGYANAESGPATLALRQANATIQGLIQENVRKGTPEALALEGKIVMTVRQFLDIDELGRRALRDHTDSISPSQLDELLRLLRNLIEQSYVNALLSNKAYTVNYLDETNGSERQVSTEVHTTRKGRPYVVQVDFHLRREGAQWRAYDVETDGVSLIRNYRAQFNRIIAKEGYEGLLARMKKRYAELHPSPVSVRLP